MYLVDGHNLIGRIPDLSLADPDDEQKLVGRLHVLAQRTRQAITVVFDPGLGYVPPQAGAYRDVKVIFAPAGSTADDLIVRKVRQARDKRQLTVITSDRDLATIVRREGCQVMRSEDFASLLGPPPREVSSEQEEARRRADTHLSEEEVNLWMAEFAKVSEKRRRKPRGASK
jgi:uncharacterized protein